MSNLRLETTLTVMTRECFNRLTLCVGLEISVSPADQISVFTGSKQQHVMRLEIPYHPSWGLLLRHQELLLNKGVVTPVNRQKTSLPLQMRV